MDTKLFKRAGAICIAAMLLLTASCGQAEEDDTQSAVVKVYEETAERFIVDGNYDSAIEVLEEGIKETNDEGLADLLEKAKARKSEQTAQGDTGEEDPETVTSTSTLNTDTPAWSAALSGIAYYGDPSACSMTQAQAETYAQLLQGEIQKVYDSGDNMGMAVPRSYAALLDLGNGVPALLFGSGMEMTDGDRTYLMGLGSYECTTWGIWQMMDGQPVKMENLDATSVYADHIYVDDLNLRIELGAVDAKVYPIENGQIVHTPSTSVSGSNFGQEGNIDGRQATEDQLNAWFDQWNPDNSLAGYTHGSDGSVAFWGMSPAEDVLDALNRAIQGGTDVETPQPAAPEQAALDQYRTILDQADTYFDDMDTGPSEATIAYKYALVQMQTGHQIPALILEQEITGGYWVSLCTARVFQYDPNSATVILTDDYLNEYVASAGGMRAYLAMSGDGVGLLETDLSSGNGTGTIRRATVVGNTLQLDTIFEGNLFDGTQQNAASLPITWHDTGDLSGLDS